MSDREMECRRTFNRTVHRSEQGGLAYSEAKPGDDNLTLVTQLRDKTVYQCLSGVAVRNCVPS